MLRESCQASSPQADSVTRQRRIATGGFSALSDAGGCEEAKKTEGVLGGGCSCTLTVAVKLKTQRFAGQSLQVESRLPVRWERCRDSSLLMFR